MSDTHEKPTPIEKLCWVLFGAAAAVYAIAGLMFFKEAQAYMGDPSTALGWVSVAQGIAGATLIPALLLTGFRQLVPALRGTTRDKPTEQAD